MSDLAEFLLARIAETETLARLVPDGLIEHEGDCCGTLCSGCGHCCHSSEECAHDCTGRGDGCITSLPVVLPDLNRIALADCDAKRLLIKRVGNPDWAGFSLLALPYADHPEYREEWKP